MLSIEIKVNGRLIAGAKAENLSGLADKSDYAVEAVEGESDVSGLPSLHHEFVVSQHFRRQSVWALVEKIAVRALSQHHVEKASRKALQNRGDAA